VGGGGTSVLSAGKKTQTAHNYYDRGLIARVRVTSKLREKENERREENPLYLRRKTSSKI